VGNQPVDNKPFHTQLIRQRSTGRAPFLPCVVILCTSGGIWPQGSYPQMNACLAFISFTEKL